jgi:hypothetical protein
MSGFFRSCMRHGAAVLFAVALVQLFAGMLVPLYALLQETRELAGNHSYGGGGMPDFMQVQIIVAALTTAMFSFFGALAIHRLDLWLGRREAAE